jgi:hypothetical protein
MDCYLTDLIVYSLKPRVCLSLQYGAIELRGGNGIALSFLFPSPTQLTCTCRIVAKYSDPKTGGTVVLIDPSSGNSETVPIPYASLGSLSVSEAGGRLLLATVGTSPKRLANDRWSMFLFV